MTVKLPVIVIGRRLFCTCDIVVDLLEAYNLLYLLSTSAPLIIQSDWIASN